MEFKYGRTLRENSFSPKHRPQPSPMKKDIFRRDLGLDDDDALPDMSSSSDEDSDGTQPSEIEFNIIQKELTTCTQQRDALRDKTEELQKTVQHLKSRLQKEEISKRSRMKMMQRTQADVLKDKQKLIEDLQDILEENGDSSSMKLVTNIEQLHKEKANLHAELMKAFDEYDTKMNEMEEKLRNAPHPIINGHNGDISQAISAEKENLEKKLLEVERQQSEEKTRNERLLKNKENEIGDLRHERDKLTDKVDTIENQMSDLKETIKQNERKLKKSEETSQKLIQEQTSQIESLESENNKLKRNVEVMQRESQSHASNQHNLDLQAHKLSDENQNLLVELKKCNKKIEDLERQALELTSSKSEVLEMKEENNELEIKLKRVGSSFDRHKATSKEKLRSVERDMEESRALMHQQRKEAAENYQELKRAMNRNEEQLKREIAESEEAFNEQKLESDKLIQRLEENLSKSKTKYSQVKEELTEVNSKLFSKLTECENMKEELETKGAMVIMTKQKLEESERVVEQKQVKIEELENKVGRVELEKENAQRQLQIMSGKSDSALAQKENETGNLRIQLNTLQNSLQAEKRKHESMAKVATEVQAKNTALEKQLCDQISKHRGEVESMVESQRVEMLKMKHDAEFATQSLTIKTKSLHKSIRQVTSVLHKLSHENTQLRREVETFPLLLQEGIKRAGKQISEALCEVNESSKDLVRRYRKEMKLRKKYHNELVELKGNIRVFVRARPRISEDGLNPKMCVSYDVNDDSLIYVMNQQRGRNQSFDVDRVFTDSSTQEEVYGEVQALVTSCMDGYHVCIFAYGQTGSGKTYTMEGTLENPGINQRALSDLFNMVEERSADWDYSVSVSLVEIYNETLKDLLNSKQEKLEIKMNADGTLFVQRLSIIPVTDLNAVNRLFEFGRSNRATASTNMNEHSSRSHAVLMVTVTGKNKTTGLETIGKLNLIDLAGSERVSKSGASGDRLKEAQNINRSLSALGDVIHSLRNKQSHVPFRNSKLTYLLQDSLSKDSKTLMVVQVSPVEKNVSETVCSLSFAQRVRLVELGQASKKTKS